MWCKNYITDISKAGGIWFVFDQPKKMLVEARTKSDQINWQYFDVDQLGYDSQLLNGAMCSLVIYHFPNLVSAFSEIFRVLKPKGM